MWAGKTNVHPSLDNYNIIAMGERESNLRRKNSNISMQTQGGLRKALMLRKINARK